MSLAAVLGQALKEGRVVPGFAANLELVRVVQAVEQAEQQHIGNRDYIEQQAQQMLQGVQSTASKPAQTK